VNPILAFGHKAKILATFLKQEASVFIPQLSTACFGVSLYAVFDFEGWNLAYVSQNCEFMFLQDYRSPALSKIRAICSVEFKIISVPSSALN